jgi:hypothetical protein
MVFSSFAPSGSSCFAVSSMVWLGRANWSLLTAVTVSSAADANAGRATRAVAINRL